MKQWPSTRSRLEQTENGRRSAGPASGSDLSSWTDASGQPHERDSRQTPSRRGVFADNRSKPIHRWYPFVEGYSADLVTGALASFESPVSAIFDPFGGSGTTALAAALEGLDSYYCEVNPYLSWVTEVKVNRARDAASSPDLGQLLELGDMVEAGFSFPCSELNPLVVADRTRHFFPPGVALYFAGAIDWIRHNLSGPVADLATLACAVSLIPASNMVRRTDLRYRRTGDPPPQPPALALAAKLRAIYDDVRQLGPALTGRATKIASDVKSLNSPESQFRLIVTSPPYLNGTNYCRNTKLELLGLGFLAQEHDLAQLRATSVTAGINNVSRGRPPVCTLPEVEEIGRLLDAVAYDWRIPYMIRQYFADMQRALAAVRNAATPGAHLFLDIGDSRFAGVHVPTPELLIKVAESVQWQLRSIEPLRQRRSYDGTQLKQVLLELHAR